MLSNKRSLIWLSATNPTKPKICSYTTVYFIVNRLFSDTNVSQGSVATLCKVWWYLLQNLFSEKKLKIG